MNEKIKKTPQYVKAILFDTRSIQKYIFSGNLLRTNIGASYIVDRLFTDILVKNIVIHEFGSENVDCTSWRQDNTDKPGLMLQKTCYVAYIGGGNALLLFKNDVSDDTLKNIVTAFSKKVLVEYPGLKTGAAIGTYDIANDETELFTQLKEYQNTVFPQTNVPYTGLTLICEVNGEVANFYDATGNVVARDGKPRFFSQEVWAKTNAFQEINGARDTLKNNFFKELKAGPGVKFTHYTFPSEIENLGQVEGESNIAIVHIDGNQMGVRFSNCRSLLMRSTLSYQVNEKTVNAFRELIKSIVADIESGAYEKENSRMPYIKLKEKFLPIRPLIIGGDDVTFVCPARVAIHYATRFMKEMRKSKAKGEAGYMISVAAKDETGKEKIYDGSIQTCAGIAILPEAYPFFRGYELAEQLCDEAKKKSRKEPSSWLDFAILHGEQAPELEQIRDTEYSGALGNMHFGPYRVDDDTDDHALAKLLQCAAGFAYKGQRKIKDLRNALQLGKHEIKFFKQQWEHMQYTLPEIEGWQDTYAENFWYPWDAQSGEESRTPYVDAIELSEYIIPALIENAKEETGEEEA